MITANVKLDWQPSEFGRPGTICAEITSRITATVCLYPGYDNPLNPVRASIYIDGVLVELECCNSIEQGKKWAESSVARYMAEHAEALLIALGMKEQTNEQD